eukprot:13318078-Alexandrium_andersonii.AAC.1
MASEGAFERRRSFLSTLPPAVTARAPRKLDVVEPGWHRAAPHGHDRARPHRWPADLLRLPVPP